MSEPSQDQGHSGQSSAGDFPASSLDEVAALLAERRTRNRAPEADAQDQGAKQRPSPEQSPDAADDDGADDPIAAEQPEEGQAEPAEGEPEQYIELDGEEVPLAQIREWKSGGMLQADYTRKTQVLAEQSKSVRQMEEALTQAHFIRMREIDETDKALERRIAQFSDVDMFSLAQENPARAAAIREQRDALREQRSQLQASRERYAAEWQQLTDYNLRQRAQAALPELKLRIRDWSDAKYAELTKHVIERGAEPEIVGKIVEPWFWELVADAMLHRKGRALSLKSAVPLSPKRSVSAGPSGHQKPRNAEADALRAARKAGSVRGQEDAVLEAMRARRKR